jgi:hypothetical protein
MPHISYSIVAKLRSSVKDGMPRHTGGVMVGGCGRLTELKCGQTPDGEGTACEALKQWDEHVPAPPLPTIEAQ